MPHGKGEGAAQVCWRTRKKKRKKKVATANTKRYGFVAKEIAGGKDKGLTQVVDRGSRMSEETHRARQHRSQKREENHKKKRRGGRDEKNAKRLGGKENATQMVGGGVKRYFL